MFFQVVQAKCYSKRIGNKAVTEAIGAIKHYNVDGGMVVVANSYFTTSAYSLAKTNELEEVVVYLS